MKKVFFIYLVVTSIACARVNLQTAEPIKVDINMRVDIYQHVVEDVNNIQSQIYGEKGKQINAVFGIEYAYAQDYSSEVTAAIERRRERLTIIEEYFKEGYIGENKDAYLQIIADELSSDLKEKIGNIVTQENKDREIIYKATAEKNEAEVSQVRKIFFDDDYKRAPSGYWFEVYDEEKGEYIWIKK